jgi:hypothetical protein
LKRAPRRLDLVDLLLAALDRRILRELLVRDAAQLVGSRAIAK